MTYDQIIYNTARKAGFSPTAAKLVVAQARLESANYTSPVFKANNATSGMKYIGQPLARRGTLAPFNERSVGCRRVTQNQVGGFGAAPCVDSDHYAAYNSVADSASDKIDRLYSISKGGVTPEMLKNASSPEEFSAMLKKRSYYGFGAYGTAQGNSEMSGYAAGLKARLKLVQVEEKPIVQDKSKTGGVIFILITAIALSTFFYFKFKNTK